MVIKISVKPHPFFKREGFDIYVDQPLTISQAVLGDQITVTTLTGSKSIEVPPGTLHGSKLKIPKEGISWQDQKHSQKGDQYVVFSITIPKNLTEEQKSIFKQLKESESKMNTENVQKSAEENKKDGFFKSFENFFQKG